MMRCALGRTRTCNLPGRSQTLFLLSYKGIVRAEGLEPSQPYGRRILSPVRLPVPPRPLVGTNRFELLSFRLSGGRSNQTELRANSCFKNAKQTSNRFALPTRLELASSCLKGRRP